MLQATDLSKTQIRPAILTELQIVTTETMNIKQLNDAAELFKECFEGPPWFEEWSLAKTRETLIGFLNMGADFLLAYNNTQLVGLSIGVGLNKINPDYQLPKGISIESTYYFAEFAVSSASRNSGLGYFLVDETLRLATAARYQYALTSTRTNNIAARKIFEKQGFRVLVEKEILDKGQLVPRVELLKTLMTG